MAAPEPPQPQHVARSPLFHRASAQVAAFHSGIARQQSDNDLYYSGRSSGKAGKEEHDEDCIQEFSDEDEEQEEGQGDSNAEDDDESETEEERDTRVDEKEREKRSAVVRIWAEYAFVDERWKRMDQGTRGDIKWARIEEDVPEVSTSASNKEK